ncbi:aegerolysin family protein [Actinomadura sp. DC4]|uniref:aegerolysin family protein n=1 Tax=Actinomadura sp. DC4 TaxID=3055069 RepID=UPI0025AEFDA8|nr:aegerolysin family protein [Actinomadura sp. DC4]MDN3356141.1 aegerolysin family protein [Actinomadura sp. DC4]
MRNSIGLAGAAAGAALLSAGLSVPAPAAHADAKRAARSVEVFLANLTRCDLLLVTARLDHGEWTTRPPRLIQLGDEGKWESESNGVGTGTEGEADYFTQACRNPAANNKRIHLHWDNPFIGSNSYDTAGTDGAFQSHIVGGSGNHAGVSFTFKPTA